MAAHKKSTCWRGHNMEDGNPNVGFQKAVTLIGNIVNTRYCKECKKVRSAAKNSTLHIRDTNLLR